MVQDHHIWDSLSPSWREFSSLLRCCGSGTLEACGSSILGILQPLCTSHDAGRDPELQLAALALVSELLQVRNNAGQAPYFRPDAGQGRASWKGCSTVCTLSLSGM